MKKGWMILVRLHENPGRAGFVYEPQDWFYSSAVDYFTTNQKGLLDIVF